MRSGAASIKVAFRKFSSTHSANASPALEECLTHLVYAIMYDFGMLRGCLLYPISKKSKKREIPFPVVFCHPGIHMGPLSKVTDNVRNRAVVQSTECKMAIEVVDKRLCAVEQAVASCPETCMDR